MDPADATELLSQLQEGEFWVEEEEFLREFDEVTVSYPITEAGHLQSLYSGNGLSGSHSQGRPSRGHSSPSGLCLLESEGCAGARACCGGSRAQPCPAPHLVLFSVERLSHALPSQVT